MKSFRVKILSLIMAISLLLGNIGMLSTPVFAEAKYAEDLFISEYIEGSSFNKAIEIYNGTGKIVDLSKYSLALNTKADKENVSDFKESSKVALEGSIVNGGVLKLVLANSRNTLASRVGVVENKSCNFNGDDFVALFKGDEIIDLIASKDTKNFAKDVTLIRNDNISKGNISGDNPKNNGEWKEEGKDYFDDFGSHAFPVGPDIVSLPVANYPDSTPVFSGTEINLNTLEDSASIKVSYYDGASYGAYEDYSAPIVIDENKKFKAKVVTSSGESDEVEFDYILHGETIKIDAARALSDGQYALVEGVVTKSSYFKSAFIQDETAAIAVLIKDGMTFTEGEKVKVYGKVEDHYGLRRLTPLNESNMEKTSSGSYEAVEINVGDDYELNEGRYVKLLDFELLIDDSDENSKDSKYGLYTVKSEGEKKLKIDPSQEEWLNVDESYKSISGILSYNFGAYRIVNDDRGTIIESNEIVKPVISSSNEEIIEANSKIILSTPTKDATIYYTLDSSEPNKLSTLYSDAINIDKDTVIKAIAYKDGAIDSSISTFTYKIKVTLDDLSISEIQGENHTSPHNLKYASNVTGIVTALINYQFDFKRDNPAIVGFYMQDPTGDSNDNTSDAILVVTDKKVKVGDSVSVTGLVKESLKMLDFYAYDEENQLTMTTLEAKASEVSILSSDNELPSFSIIGKGGRVVPHDEVSSDNFSEYNPSKYAIDYYESLEAMRVEVENPYVVAATHNRTLSIVPDNGEVLKADGELANYGGLVGRDGDENTEILQVNKALHSLGNVNSIKAGASSEQSVKGILDYEWGTYHIYASEDLPTFENPVYDVDELTLDKSDDKLMIASYNVYNHSGVESSLKTKAIAENIVNVIKSPDIIGLVEVQDNDGAKEISDGVFTNVSDANKTYEDFIEAVVKAGGPRYEWTDINPVLHAEGGEHGGNIRVGYLYNPSRVTLATGIKGGSKDTIDVNEDGSLTLNPGRIAASESAFNGTRKPLVAEFIYKGESVFVIANHLSSKGGDNARFGNIQPAIKVTEAERVKQAKLVNDFVTKLLSKKADANIVVLGDLNDYHYSNPLKAIKGDNLVNMIDKLPTNEQYTYTFAGVSQVLDNILISKNLEVDTEVDIVNINSIQSDVYKKATKIEGTDDKEIKRPSDHDPVVINISNLGKENSVNGVIFSSTGIVEKDTMLALSTSTEGAKVYFAIDKDLDLVNLENNTLYTEAIKISKDVTINAIAIKGEFKSPVRSEKLVMPPVHELVTISEALAKDLDTLVEIKALVVSKPGAFGGTSIIISDESSNTYIFNPKIGGDVVVGSELLLTVRVGEYKGTRQLNYVSYKLLANKDVAEAIYVSDFEKITKELDYKLIEMKRLKVTKLSSDKFGNTTIELEKNGVLKKAKIDSRSGVEFDTIAGKIKVGDFVKVKGFASLGYITIKLTSEDSIEIDKSAEERDIVLENLSLKNLLGQKITSTGKNTFISVNVDTRNNADDKSTKGVLVVKIEKDGSPCRIGMVNGAKSSEGEFSIGFDTVGMDEGKYEVKVYFWNTITGMEALSLSKSMSFTVK